MSVAAERRGAADSTVADSLRGALPFLAILAAALVLRQIVGGVTDVSWQITLCEKILAGKKLYIDLLEVNPPASTFLYLPAVALARALHLPPEIVIDLQTLIAACTSLIVTKRILDRAPQFGTLMTPAACLVVLAILTLLPMRVFAQREHYALMATLPFLAMAALRIARITPLNWQWMAVGAGAGMAVCIKPHFAIAFVFVATLAAIRLRGIRVLFAPENWIAGLFAALYAASVIVFYPDFVRTMMPLLADVYLPAKQPFFSFVLLAPVALSMLAFAMAIAIDRTLLKSVVFRIVIAASAGFAIAFLMQGKGWPYQSYPMIALALMGCGMALLAARARRIACGATLLALGAVSAIWFDAGADTRAVAAEIRKVAHRPSIAVIAGDIALGHPLTREVEGEWVPALCSLWIMNNANALMKAGRIAPDAKARVESYIDQDRQRLIADMRDRKPTIVLVNESDPAWSEWAASDRNIAMQLAHYTRMHTIDGVTIYRRKSKES